MSAAVSVFKLSVQNVHQLQQHNDRSLFRNDRIILSTNSCGRSFHIDSKAVFSSAMLVGFDMYFWKRPSITSRTWQSNGKFGGHSFFPMKPGRFFLI